MEQILLITNEMKDPDRSATRKVAAYLEERGVATQCVAGGRYPTNIKDKHFDCALVLGGDGTMLKAARDLPGLDIPFFGINMGKLGYLTGAEMNNVSGALDQLLKGEYEKESRMMITGAIYRTDQEEADARDFALNDIVITRSGPMQILNFDLYVNGSFLNNYSADGLLIATPTGSTGYNLSAGGPIVEPSARLLVVTPICPHTLNTRSIILSPEDRVSVQILQGKDGNAQTLEVTFDGGHNVPLSTGDRVDIHRARETTEILKLKGGSFLTTLHRKMSEA